MLSIKNVKDTQWGKFFTVVTTEGVEIHGCKLASGKNGDFVSPPSRKDEKSGKYFNHAYFPQTVGDQIVALVNGGSNQDAGYPAQQDYQEPPFDPDSDIPF